MASESKAPHAEYGSFSSDVGPPLSKDKYPRPPTRKQLIAIQQEYDERQTALEAEMQALKDAAPTATSRPPKEKLGMLNRMTRMMVEVRELRKVAQYIEDNIAVVTGTTEHVTTEAIAAGLPPPPIGFSAEELEEARAAVQVDTAPAPTDVVRVVTTAADEVEVNAAQLDRLTSGIDGKLTAASAAMDELQRQGDRLRTYNDGFEQAFTVPRPCPCCCLTTTIAASKGKAKPKPSAEQPGSRV